MGLLDFLTGGKSSEASGDVAKAVKAIEGVQTPTAAQLTLPQLEQYVQQGILTPEQVQAYLVNNNALSTIGAGNEGLSTELASIGSLSDIMAAGGNDAQEKANVQDVLNQLGTTEKGANLAALDQEAQRGTSNSGLTLAGLLSGQEGEAMTANKNALDAAAAAEQRNIAATEAAANIGSGVQGQEYNADLNKANAANAIAEFNAGQNTVANETNVAAKNLAAEKNLNEKQAVANANVGSKQLQQESGTAAQQQAFQDALEKATGVSSAYENAANNANTQGQQQAGIIGGLISGAGQIGSAMVKPPVAASNAPGTAAHGGEVCMEGGGAVPGEPKYPGVDTTANDTVDAKLTPHEIVIPQTIAQRRDPREIMQFVRSLPPVEKLSIHPKAVLDTLRALNLHHQEPVVGSQRG